MSQSLRAFSAMPVLSSMSAALPSNHSRNSSLLPNVWNLSEEATAVSRWQYHDGSTYSGKL